VGSIGIEVSEYFVNLASVTNAKVDVTAVAPCESAVLEPVMRPFELHLEKPLYTKVVSAGVREETTRTWKVVFGTYCDISPIQDKD
jgi:hypothetical protein